MTIAGSDQLASIFAFDDEAVDLYARFTRFFYVRGRQVDDRPQNDWLF